jgi:hypothetical protein
MKVSVDQFSQNGYVPIRNPQGGGADISSFLGKKLGNKNTGSALDMGQN